MKKTDAKTGQLLRLLEIMQQLRAPETGCPWDQKQSFESIVPHKIEEENKLSQVRFLFKEECSFDIQKENKIFLCSTFAFIGCVFTCIFFMFHF